MNPVVILIGLVALVTGIGLTYSYPLDVNGFTTYPYFWIGIVIALFGFLTIVAGFAIRRGNKTDEKDTSNEASEIVESWHLGKKQSE